MVNWSEEVVLPTVSVMVMIVEFVITNVAEAMSRPVIKVIFGITDVLNSKPAGAFNKSVRPVPLLKSCLIPSVMTMEPSVVQAGEAALAALSAEILAPFMAEVMLTVASAEGISKQKGMRSKTHKPRP